MVGIITRLRSLAGVTVPHVPLDVVFHAFPVVSIPKKVNRPSFSGVPRCRLVVSFSDQLNSQSIIFWDSQPPLEGQETLFQTPTGGCLLRLFPLVPEA